MCTCALMHPLHLELETAILNLRTDENRLDCPSQTDGAIERRAGAGGNRRCAPLWRQPGTVQRFARIDVADAGDDPLVEQRNL